MNVILFPSILCVIHSVNENPFLTLYMIIMWGVYMYQPAIIIMNNSSNMVCFSSVSLNRNVIYYKTKFPINLARYNYTV